MLEKVKNQHYIPRSYLKNFGYIVSEYVRPSGKTDRKWGVFNKENGGEIKHNNIKKICKELYLYDLPFVDESNVQFIEHAYDKEVDRFFPEITVFVTDDSNTELSIEMREKIIKCCLSLYYRTPKFVSVDETFIDLISVLPKEEQDDAYKIKKTQLLEKHLADFERLVKFKLNDGIAINKAVGKWEFITGDNPVIIREGSNKLEDVLHPRNIIHIPITSQYCITITPNSETSLQNKFTRIDYSDIWVMGINTDIERLHEQYLIGSKKGLEDYESKSPEFLAKSDENHPILVNAKALVKANLHTLIESSKHGVLSIQHQEVFMNYWNNLEVFRKDPNNIRYKKIYGF